VRNTRVTGLLLAGSLGLGGAVTGLVVAPAVATAATSETSASQALSDRVSRITGALSGLVSDGTLSQEQADRVAGTLAEQLPDRGRGGHGPGGSGGHGPGGSGGHGPGGSGGHGGHFGPGRGLGPVLDTAAETLGVTAEELRAFLRGGQSLAGVAAAEGVDRQALVDALVAAASEHVDEHLTNGAITQDQADARKAGLAERVAELVDREGLHGGGGRGPRPSADSSDSSTDGSGD
jgi:hypothetical protein